MNLLGTKTLPERPLITLNLQRGRRSGFYLIYHKVMAIQFLQIEKQIKRLIINNKKDLIILIPINAV